MEKSSFFNAQLTGETYDRVYSSEDFARYFASFIGNGVFPNPSTNLQVKASNNMTVILKTGKAWINGYSYENTSDLILNVDVADGVLGRIDRVVLRLDFTNREIKCYVKKGVFSSSPVAPDLTRNSDVYELGIAELKIKNGVTTITQADITDLRQNSSYCGIVHGVVDQVDTTTLFNQYQVALDMLEQGYEADFTTWFNQIKGQLTTDAAGNLQTQINSINNQILDDKATSIITDKSLTSLPNAVNGTLNIDRIQGKTLVNLSKFTSLTTTDLKYYTNLLDNKLIQNRIVTAINNTGRNIKVVVVNSTTGSFLRELSCNNQITNISTLGTNESLSYFNGYKSDGWTDSNKNDLLKVMVLDGTVNFAPSYFEGIKSVGEDNWKRIEISTIGKNLLSTDNTIVLNDLCSFLDGKIISKDTSGGKAAVCYCNHLMFLEKGSSYMLSFPEGSSWQILSLIPSDLDASLVENYYATTDFRIQQQLTVNTPFIVNCTGYYRLGIYLAYNSSVSKCINGLNIQLCKSDGTMGYEVYKEDRTEISLSVPLREWDYLDRNTVCRNSLSVVYDGSEDENWNVYQFTNLCAFIAVPSLIRGYTNSIRCAKFATYDRISTEPDGTQGIANERVNETNSGFFIGIKGLATDVTSWKAWLQANPITIVYKTATETTEPLGVSLSLTCYNKGYLQVKSGSINPTINASYPTNLGEKVSIISDTLDNMRKIPKVFKIQFLDGVLNNDEYENPSVVFKKNGVVHVHFSVKINNPSNESTIRITRLPIGFRPILTQYVCTTVSIGIFNPTIAYIHDDGLVIFFIPSGLGYPTSVDVDIQFYAGGDTV